MGRYFCECERFVVWYVSEAADGSVVRVCTCGHRAGDHIDGTGMCTGDVVIEGRS